MSTAQAYLVDKVHLGAVKIAETLNIHILVRPIQAVFSQEDFSTKYQASFINPSGGQVQYIWSGPDCGTTTALEGRTADSSGKATFT